MFCIGSKEERRRARNRFANLDLTPNPGTTGITDVVYNIGFMGMYRDNESKLAQNWNRYFDRHLGRYTQPDRIGLDGGPNRYPYANLNPLKFMDPTGLWSAEIGGFAGWGASLNFGHDQGAGRGFATLQFGYGLGGGIQYDRNGGLPPGVGDLACEDDEFLGGVAKTGISLPGIGIDLATVAGGVGLNSNRLYSGADWLGGAFGTKWGFKAEASGGVQYTRLLPSRFPQQCGCNRSLAQR